MATAKLNYNPQPKQQLLHHTTAKQILYGGSAGGGKSHALRWDGLIFAIQNAGLQCYLFRKTLTELDDNHIRFIQDEIPGNVARYYAADKLLEFVNGSIMRFCYAERPQDINRYQGAEMHWVGIDEATHFQPQELAFLRTRNRLGKFQISPGFRDKTRLPRTVYATNPGGPGHSFLKQIFIDTHEPMEIFYDETTKDPDDPEDHGWSSIYIPARMRDNLYLDKGYAGVFSGLPEERARALRDGDWDAVVGAALDTLSKDRHLVRYFKPPLHWVKFMSMDWGTRKPFAVGWFTVASEDTIVKFNKQRITEDNPDGEILIPEGAIILYREYYGWNGKPDEGCRMDSSSVARKILEIEHDNNEVMDYRVADSSMWARSDGPSSAERMEESTDHRITLTPAKKDRAAAYNEWLCRLAGNPKLREDGIIETDPMLFITDNCQHFWRTVPILTVDDRDPDKGVGDTHQEDHMHDLTSYALRSRPFTMTEEDRWEEMYGTEMRRMRRKSVDPYATS